MRFPFRFFYVHKKIALLEKKISDIEAMVNSDTSKNNETMKKDDDPETIPFIKIEHLQVDKIIIQKLDYANNFGQLGIKELTGKLNIGTSYEGDVSKKVNEKMSEKTGTLSKVSLKGKKELD